MSRASGGARRPRTSAPAPPPLRLCCPSLPPSTPLSQQRANGRLLEDPSLPTPALALSSVSGRGTSTGPTSSLPPNSPGSLSAPDEQHRKRPVSPCLLSPATFLLKPTRRLARIRCRRGTFLSNRASGEGGEAGGGARPPQRDGSGGYGPPPGGSGRSAVPRCLSSSSCRAGGRASAPICCISWLVLKSAGGRPASPSVRALQLARSTTDVAAPPSDPLRLFLRSSNQPLRSDQADLTRARGVPRSAGLA